MEAASVRQASRTVRNWVAQRARRPVMESAPRRLIRFPWWAYPLTAAAVIVVVFLVWSTNRPIGETVAQDDHGMSNSEYNQPFSPDNPRVDWFADRLERSFDGAPELLDPNGNIGRLSDVEGEAVALAGEQTQASVFDDESSQ
jgi:hypothetical protein